MNFFLTPVGLLLNLFGLFSAFCLFVCLFYHQISPTDNFVYLNNFWCKPKTNFLKTFLLGLATTITIIIIKVNYCYYLWIFTFFSKQSIWTFFRAGGLKQQADRFRSVVFGIMDADGRRKWKVPSRLALIGTMAGAETGFPLWNKTTVELLWAKISLSLFEDLQWKNTLTPWWSCWISQLCALCSYDSRNFFLSLF